MSEQQASYNGNAVQLGGSSVEVRMDVHGITIISHHRPYHDPLMIEATKRLLKTRFVLSSGGDPKDQSVEARCRFYDETVIGLEGAEWQGIPIGPHMDLDKVRATGHNVDRWTELIPASWKTGAATFFEERKVAAKAEIDRD